MDASVQQINGTNPLTVAPADTPVAIALPGGDTLWRATFDSQAARVAVLDEHGSIAAVSASWRRFAAEAGATTDFVGENYLEICDASSGELAAAAAQGLREMLDGERETFEMEYPCHAPGRRAWFLLRATCEHVGGRRVVVVAHEEITTRHEAQERAYVQTALLDEVDASVIVTDLDRRVLTWNAGAESLYGWSQAEAVGRPIGELLSPEDPASAASNIAALHRDGQWDGEYRLRRKDGSMFSAYARTRVIYDGDGAARALIGVSVDISKRLAAERALLESRNDASAIATSITEGLFTVVFHDISERKAREARAKRDAATLSGIVRVRKALVEDRFMLFAQPIIDVATGATVQRELLLRLQEPDGEILEPTDFLPIAEEYGLVGEVDRWVIDRGAAIAASGCPVEINISGASIGDVEILEHIERAIERTGADPSLLVLEITETAVADDQAASLAFAERLRRLGCKIALDDFGTGYGGFTYLKQFPVDYLKIDTQFVCDLATSIASRHVVQAVVALARGFGLQTVAEGVEDGDALALLSELGVDFAQGRHIATPQPLIESLGDIAT